MMISPEEIHETGIELIDDQHHKLVEIINEASELDTKANSEVLNMLDKLEEYFHIHFLTEEQLMRESRYPDIATKLMIEQHDEFTSYLHLRIIEFRTKDILNLETFESFLQTFLKDHEIGLDQNLANWIINKEHPVM